MKKSLLIFSLAYVLATIFLSLTLTGCSLDLSQPAEVEEQADALDDRIEPNPDLSPGEVIKIQVEALQNNDSQDKGIEITFRFASPANKRVTGPLNRFRRLVKNPPYSPMLNHKIAEYGPLEISGNKATQRVTIIEANGSATVYLFSLSKQSTSPCKGCWMTDSVTIVPVKPQDLQGA